MMEEVVQSVMEVVLDKDVLGKDEYVERINFFIKQMMETSRILEMVYYWETGSQHCDGKYPGCDKSSHNTESSLGGRKKIFIQQNNFSYFYQLRTLVF